MAIVSANMTDRNELIARLTALTRDLVLIPSTESRPDERRRAVEFVANHLEALDGIDIQRHRSRGYESLVALPEGVDQPEVLFCGHVDVVEHAHLERYGSTVENGRIIGPGAGDMKGAVAIILELFRQWQSRQPGVSIGLAITSDEERGGTDGVRYLLEDQGLRCGQAIVPDGGSLNDLTVAEKGVLHVRLTTMGQTSHGARPWLGDNALQRLLERLQPINDHFMRDRPTHIDPDGDHWFTTCTTTIVKTSNTTANCVPDDAEAVLDIRFTPPASVSMIVDKVKELAGPVVGVQPMMQAEPSHLDPDPVFRDVTEQVTGRPVRTVRASGGSDARFFCQFGIPVNLSRPNVGQLHADDEWIDIESMAVYFEICDTYLRQKFA